MQHTITIEKIIPGGKGLARTASGQVIITLFTLPGEQVVVKEQIKKSGYLEGVIEHVLSPSPERTSPFCPLYGECGGCDLQHSSYHEQLVIKRGVVIESLQRAKVPITEPDRQVQQTLASPNQWGYRYRLRLKINAAGKLGFYKKRSHTFIPITHCPVASQGICGALAELNQDQVFRSFAGTYAEIELLESSDHGEITLVLRGNKDKRPPTKLLQRLDKLSSLAHVAWIIRKGIEYVTPQAEPLSQHIQFAERDCLLSWSGGCFSQVNPGQNEQLIQLVCTAAGELHGKSVLDLYCGMGNFSIPLALMGGTVTGIEGNQESIDWAEENVRHAGMNARFFVADVRSALEQLTEQREKVDLILLDPPRSGVGKQISLLPRLEPTKIIYVSCDPATLARDLNILCAHNYQITQVTPVDMFPQTCHVESVVLLQKT